MDTLFLRQVWAGNETLLLSLLGDDSPLGRARRHYFLMNKGPWSRLDKEASFIPGVGAKPAQANFYPAEATREEVEAWMKGLPAAEAERARGFFTTIRRGSDGRLTAVPYSLEYQPELAEAARLLREAAQLTRDATLKKFLTTRADAFLSNDYYASDVAWMELDSAIEPTIGPYEVYEDEWFNFKAAFEAFITVRDEAESRKLQAFSAHLQELEYFSVAYRQVLNSEGLYVILNASHGFGHPGTQAFEAINFKTRSNYAEAGLASPLIRTRELNLTLLGFVRDDRFNIYAGDVL